MAKTKEALQKLRHNWNWFAAIAPYVAGILSGIVATMYYWDRRIEALALLHQWSREIVMMVLISLVLSRMIAVARWPRNPPLDYNKISGPGVVAAHFLTIVMGFILIIITLAFVAPGVLELFAKHLGN